MPELKFDPLDWLTVLEVEPEIGDYEVRYFYRVERDGLILEIEVKPLYRSVEIALFKDGWESSLTRFVLLVQGQTRRVFNKRGEWLELEECWLVPRLFLALHEGQPQNLTTVKIFIKPQIRVVFDA